MKIKLLAMVTCSLMALGLNSNAMAWQHLQTFTVAKNDTVLDVPLKLNIDYELQFPDKDFNRTCYRCNSFVKALPLWFNVYGQKQDGQSIFNENSTVTLELGNTKHSDTSDGMKTFYQIKLIKQPEGHYSGQFSSAKKWHGNDLGLLDTDGYLPVYSSGFHGEFTYSQHLDIIIDLDGNPDTISDTITLQRVNFDLYQNKLN